MSRILDPKNQDLLKLWKGLLCIGLETDAISYRSGKPKAIVSWYFHFEKETPSYCCAIRVILADNQQLWIVEVTIKWVETEND